MTLSQMKMLVMIADTGSLGAAAKSLNRTVAAVSLAIKKLEADVGLNLFDRNEYRISLTSQGNALCEKCRIVLGQSEELETLTKQLTAGEEAELRIALVTAAPTSTVLEVLRKCEFDYPSTSLSLFTGSIFRPTELLLNGDVEIATILWENDNECLESIPFYRVQLVPVCAPGYIKFSPEEEIPISALKKSRQVIMRSADVASGDTKYYGRLQDSNHWEVNEDHTKKAVIVAGMGWGRLPVHMIKNELKQGNLVRMKIKNFPSITNLEVRVARRAGQPVGPVAERLWHYFEEMSPILNGDSELNQSFKTLPNIVSL